MGEATATTDARDVRTALLDAAEAHVAQVGGAAVSLRAIAREAGVSHQAPAHFFRSKQGLLTAVALRLAERLEAMLRACAHDGEKKDPLEALADLGMVYVEVAHSSPALFRLVSAAGVIDTKDPALVAVRERCFDVLRASVDRAQATGWRAELPAEQAVLISWVLVHGSAGLWSDGWLSDVGTDDEVRALIRQVLVGAQ